MRLQILASGSKGNASLIRVGEVTLLLDAGLGPRCLRERLTAAGVGVFGVQHVLLSHAHKDHARSAGLVSRRYRAVLHAPEVVLRQRACARASALATLPVNGESRLTVPGGEPLRIDTIALPHDCDPTLGFRFEHAGRVLVHLTDLGEARDELARALYDPHVLVIEANHDSAMLASGPYPEALRRRVGGPRGHLSNGQMADLLTRLAGPRLHTVVLAHLSRTNNREDLAVEAARAALDRAGRSDVVLRVAAQDSTSEELSV